MRPAAISVAALAAVLGLASAHPARAMSFLEQTLLGEGSRETALGEAVRDTGLGDPPADATSMTLLGEGYAAATKGDLRTAAHRIAWAMLRGGLTADQARIARLSLSDEMSLMGHPDVAADLLAPLAGDPAFDVQSRRAFALQGAGKTAAAAEAFAKAAESAPDRDNRVLMTRGRIFALDKLGDPAATLAALRDAAAREGFQGRDAVDLAYVALKNKDDRLALQLFAAADRSGELKDMAALDAGYTARRAGDEKTAARYFKKGLQTAVRRSDPAQAQNLYGVRREVEALTRRWGAYASMFYDNSAAQSATVPGAGRGNLQVGGEVFYRPLGYNGGRPVEVFFRAFETLDSRSGDPTGAQTTQGWIGVRAMVLAEQNLVLEGSRMLKLGDRSINDWMLRASYSATSGLDLKADRSSWPFGNVFVDGARLIDAGETFATVDGRAGWAFQLGGLDRGVIVAPFAGATVSYDSGLAQDTTALGAGPGVWVRKWFRGSDDSAPRSYVDLLLQYRLRVSGGKRAEGLFTSLSLSY